MIDRLQEFIETADFLYREELGRRLLNPAAPDAPGLAYRIRQALDGVTGEQMRAEIRDSDEWRKRHEPPPPPSGFVTPLVGPVRPRGKSFGDDSGPRNVRVCSRFSLLREAMEDWDGTQRTLDLIAQYYHGVRYFCAVGCPPFWQGREVLPNDSRYDATFLKVGEALRQRGLRASLTTGDMEYLYPGGVGETTLNRRIGQLCAAVGDDWVMLRGVWNEGWMRWTMPDGTRTGNAWQPSAARAGEMLAAYREGYKGGLLGTTDNPESEEPDEILKWLHALSDVAIIHGSRWPEERAIRRAFNLMYEGHPIFKKSVVQDEPTGEGPYVYHPVPDRDWLFGIYTMMLVTGQAITHFNNSSLFIKEPLDTYWSFAGLPERWSQMAIPEDIGQWKIVPGHREEAPLTAQFNDGNTPGPHRVDQSRNGNHAWAVAYSGLGEWKLTSRWDADYEVWSAAGRETGGTVTAGGRLPTMHAGMKVRVIHMVKR